MTLLREGSMLQYIWVKHSQVDSLTERDFSFVILLIHLLKV